MRLTSSIRPALRAEGADAQAFFAAGLEPLADLADRGRQLDAALARLLPLAGDAGRSAIAALQSGLAGFEPAVTFLGQVKSGKTTLVNALAGWSDLLPCDVNPWTSVVTSLHLSPGAQRRDVGARFQLVMENEWDRLLKKGGRLGELAQRADAGGELEKIRHEIEAMRAKSRARLGKKFEMMLGQVHEYGYFDKNLLERYICLGDDFLTVDEAGAAGKQGWFADITKSADLFLHSQTMPHPICLRDTPGVNDTFLMREQVTINAIQDSRICVVVLSAQQALTSTDMGLIRLISNLRSRNVIIFVNRIDELQAPGAEVAEIEAAIRATLARHDGPAGARILFGSGLWANRVLAQEVDDLPAAGLAALRDWAAAQARDCAPDWTNAELAWHLSGVPALNRAIADQIVTSLGDPFLRKLAGAAVTLAGSLQAANTVRVAGRANGRADGRAGGDPGQAAAAVAALAGRHQAALQAELEEVTVSFRDRADRAHANFLQRATHSLIRHLEEWGDDMVWEYDPAGLRVLLRSAHSVLVARSEAAARARCEAAVQDFALLLYTHFGDAVEGIELVVPELPDAPPPVLLARTIALDFNDGWWVSWWRRTRGYKAFSEKFHGMIAAETQDYMAEFKNLPPAVLHAPLRGLLADFLGQAGAIVQELADSAVDQAAAIRALPGSSLRDRRQAIEAVLADLRPHATRAGREGAAA